MAGFYDDQRRMGPYLQSWPVIIHPKPETPAPLPLSPEDLVNRIAVGVSLNQMDGLKDLLHQHQRSDPHAKAVADWMEGAGVVFQAKVFVLCTEMRSCPMRARIIKAWSKSVREVMRSREHPGWPQAQT